MLPPFVISCFGLGRSRPFGKSAALDFASYSLKLFWGIFSILHSLLEFFSIIYSYSLGFIVLFSFSFYKLLMFFNLAKMSGCEIQLRDMSIISHN